MTERLIGFTVSGSERARLDVIVSDHLSGVVTPSPSRSFCQKLIESEFIRVNGRICSKCGEKVGPGAQIEIAMPEVADSSISQSDRKLEILFEDQHLLVINKPPGLSMHPGAGRKDDTLLNAVIGSLIWEDDSSGRPGIVHRLDMDTSGVVVVAKTPHVHAALSSQFAARSIHRTYKCLVFTTPRASREINRMDSGRIETFIGRNPRNRMEMAVLPRGGKRAITNWYVEERFSYGAFLRVKLETGRTHQIRVHLEHIGSPVVGDRTYGDLSGLPKDLQRLSESFGRQALHASELGFIHPVSGQQVIFASDPPEDMQRLVEGFRRYKI